MLSSALRRNCHLRNVAFKGRLSGTMKNGVTEAAHPKSIPPFLARVAVVGTSVGLASPLFAIVGAGGMWFSYLPKSALGRVVKYGLALAVGGGFTTLLVNYLGSFLAHNSDFVLPFAISNMVASAFWYTVGELRYGSEVMTQRISVEILEKKVPFTWMKSLLTRFSTLGVPVAGPVIGALTALTVPFLWPIAFRNFWNKDFQDLILNDNFTWISTFYEWIFFPIGLPVGIFSGLVMHQTLKNAVSGVPNKPWTKTTLPVLVGVLGAAAYYFTQCKSNPDDMMWYRRMDPITGTMKSYNARTGEYRNDGGAIGRVMSKRRGFISFITSWLKMFKPFMMDYYDGELELETASETAYTDRHNRAGHYTYRPRTADGEFSAHNIEDDVLVHRLVDIIVRRKFLELSQEEQQNIANTAATGAVASVSQTNTAATTADVGTDSNADAQNTTYSQNKDKKLSKQDKVLFEQCQSLSLPYEEVSKLVRDIELIIVEAKNRNHQDKSKPLIVAPKSPPVLETEINTNARLAEKRMKELLPNSSLDFYTQPNNRALLLLLDNLNLVEEAYLSQLNYIITEEKGHEIVQKYNKELFWRRVYVVGASLCTAAAVVTGVMVMGGN